MLGFYTHSFNECILVFGNEYSRLDDAFARKNIIYFQLFLLQIQVLRTFFHF